MPDFPIYTAEDVTRHEEALAIALTLTGEALVKNAALEVHGAITREEAARRAGIMGIITGTLAYEITEVKRYVQEWNERAAERERLTLELAATEAELRKGAGLDS